eukprot:gene7288-9930_t
MQGDTGNEEYIYDEARLIDSLPECLRCIICHGVAQDMMEHMQCDTIFCKKCIDGYVAYASASRKHECPHCNMSMKNDMKKANRHIREMHSKLRIKCINSPACSHEGIIETIKQHEMDCGFGEITCPQCNEKLIRSQKMDHDSLHCKSRRIPCTFCHMLLLFRDLNQHIENICMVAPIACEYCYESTTRLSRSNHNDICPKLPIRCKYRQCNEILPRNGYATHTEKCKFRTIKCAYCFDDVIYSEYIKHTSSFCLIIPIQCCFCSDTINRSGVNDHYLICPNYKVKCSLGCEALIDRKDENGHAANCNHRMESCYFCQFQLKFKDLSAHQFECEKLFTDCPYCLTLLKKRNLDEHLNSKCRNRELMEVTCPVENCGFRCPKKDLVSHYKDPDVAARHIEHLLIDNRNLRSKIQELRQEMERNDTSIRHRHRNEEKMNYKDNTAEREICRNFLKNSCRFGDKCKRLHITG